MALFKIENTKTTKINIIRIEKERDIQKLFENNLEIILDIYFLDSEYSTSFGGRIDTLGIDKNGSPVIIEYKKNQNDNIINQGLSYLKWLLDHKADFEKLVSAKLFKRYLSTNPHIKKITEIPSDLNKVEWTSPRVICIAESYNKFDLDTIEMLPIKIELLKYKLYENNILQLESEKQSKIKISTAKIYSKSTKEKRRKITQKDYSVDDHLKNAAKPIRKLYLNLRERIKSLDETIAEEAKTKYIAYKLTTNFVDIIIYKNSLKIFLNMPSGKLNDPHSLARDLTKPKPIGHWGNGDYEVKFSKFEDLDKIFELVKQSYNYNK